MKFLHRNKNATTTGPATVVNPVPATAYTAAPVNATYVAPPTVQQSYFAVPPLQSANVQQPTVIGAPTTTYVPPTTAYAAPTTATYAAPTTTYVPPSTTAYAQKSNLVYVGTTRSAPVTLPPVLPATLYSATTTTSYTGPVTGSYLNGSYSKMLKRIHLLNEAMMRLSRERIAQEELDPKGQRVLAEMQVVLSDIETFMVTKNGDMKFQQLADHFFTLAGELRNDRELSAFVSSWKSARSGNANNVEGVINNVSLLFHDIKASRNIYQAANEGIKLAEYMLDSEGEHDLESQKKKVYDEIIGLLKGISENPRWQAMSGTGKETAQNLNARARQAVSNRPHLRLSMRPTFNMFMYDLRRAIAVLMVDHDGEAVDNFFKAINTCINDALNTPAYHQFMHDAKEAGTEIMEDPDILEDPATRELLWNLWNTFVEMISEVKKHPSFQEAFQHAKHIFKSLIQDPYAHNILSHAKILLKDIHQNDSGKLMDFTLIPQFKHILVPLLLESFREVSIPPIQGVTPDKKLKYHVSGMVLSSIEMLPENIKIEATYRMNTDPLRLDVHEKDIIIWIEADKVRARVTGAAWNYERLTFPRIGDTGLASVILGGHGARVGAKIRIHKQGNEHVMQVIDSYCVISRLDLAMYDCKYSMLYKIGHRTLVKQLKSVIELGVAEKLTQLVTGLDRTVLNTIMRLQTAKNAVIKTAHAGKKKIMKRKIATSGTINKEKKSKKEKIMGMATSASTKRRGLSLLKKARKTTQAKAEARPSLEELNHAPPPAPLAPGMTEPLPPLVAPNTHQALPPLIAPNTHQALPPLVAPSTNTALPPLVAPSTNTALPPLVAPNTNTALPPLAAPSTPLRSAPGTPSSLSSSIPSTPVNTPASIVPPLTRSSGVHVTSTIESIPERSAIATTTSTTAPAHALEKNLVPEAMLPNPTISGNAAI